MLLIGPNYPCTFCVGEGLFSSHPRPVLNGDLRKGGHNDGLARQLLPDSLGGPSMDYSHAHVHHCPQAHQNFLHGFGGEEKNCQGHLGEDKSC